MPSQSLKELLIEEIKDLYNAEKQLVTALPKLAKAAQNEELKTAFTDHLEETRGHVARLENVFKLLKEPAKGKICPAMKGLVQEGAEAIEDHDASPVRDAQLIGSAQRVEHYEIAAYGTVRALAETLEEDEIVGIFQATLDEEGAADKKLTAIAEIVNREALEAEDEETD